MFRSSLIVFARPPVAGFAKTRLIPRLGAERAARLYGAFLADVCATGAAAAATVGARRVLAVAGDPAHPSLAGLDGWERVAQADGDLGQRMRVAIDAELLRAERVCLVGSDAPTVPHAYLEQAFALLVTHEVVVGPSTDGGYWLIGARRAIPELFTAMPWSTPRVLVETLARLRGRSVGLLPFHYDVDEPADLELLVRHLTLDPALAPQTRAALEEEAVLY
jgi:rSAM/selenodomain-associated transferase 1